MAFSNLLSVSYPFLLHLICPPFPVISSLKLYSLLFPLFKNITRFYLCMFSFFIPLRNQLAYPEDVWYSPFTVYSKFNVLACFKWLADFFLGFAFKSQKSSYRKIIFLRENVFKTSGLTSVNNKKNWEH